MKYILFVSEYSLLSRDELCSDKGMITIQDMYDCKKAVIALDINVRPEDVKVVWKYESPPGCYEDTISQQVVFNRRIVGTARDHLAMPICRNG